MDLTIDIIIVNWNSGKQLHDCLESITNEPSLSFIQQVIVVDNGSTDQSMNLTQEYNLPLVFIENQTNLGFAAACNQGARRSNADLLLFLNPDCKLLEDSLSKPRHFLASSENSNVGIVGIQLISNEGTVSKSCSRFPTPKRLVSKMLGLDQLFPFASLGTQMREWQHDKSRAVDQVIGAFFLIRRSLFVELGGFDERFFVYYEEVDLSYRAKLMGWNSYYLSEANAFHRGGGTSSQVKALRLFYSLRSRILYGYKHFDIATATALALGTLFLEPILRLFRLLVQCSTGDVSNLVKAFTLLWSWATGSLMTKKIT